ncbi:uncharacterized protein LOC134211049 [Armigeres subalbatus]|uniref:uncharacterized protein LOC134211049 n=1 Tax=Armigeres subalbatus TaxID=124917 RepID=UPI002ED6709E
MATARRSRKMVGGRKMSDMETIRLVELYRHHELLWNPSHPDYTLRARRFQCYRELMDEMDMGSVEEVKKKIKSLRDTYTAERNRNIKSGGQYQIKLVWYDILDEFLSPVAQYSVKKESIEEYLDTEQVHEAEELVQPLQDVLPTIHEHRRMPRPILYKVLGKPKSTKKIRTRGTFEPPRQSAHEFTDEFHYFGLSIASQLRNMAPVDAFILQDKIQNLISVERIEAEKRKMVS